jgi:hypothetical protein
VSSVQCVPPSEFDWCGSTHRGAVSEGRCSPALLGKSGVLQGVGVPSHGLRRPYGAEKSAGRSRRRQTQLHDRGQRGA